MEVRVFGDCRSLAQAAAAIIAADGHAAIRSRGRFVVALSGGRTPRPMFRELAGQDLSWNRVRVVQVDERVAPAAHADRNLTHLRENLLQRAPGSLIQVHAMPVESDDLAAAAAAYSATLRELAGSPPVLDLVHLGLGSDGHTASLVPGDPVLDIDDADVAVTMPYEGRRRMTLTFPPLNRARRVLWVVTGNDKAEMLGRLCRGDFTIPAGRVRRDRALLLADEAAAGAIAGASGKFP